MDNQMVTRQLNIEIEKLKVGDYTSYQNFYSMTSNYLYTNVWNNVQDQNATYDIMNGLYTDIYASIGTELTDNNQFFEWLDSKLFTHVTTYLTTHNMPCAASERNGANRTEQAAVIAAGMNTAMGGGNASAGIGSAGGSGYAGMGSATGGNGYAGMGSATGGNGYAGINTPSGGNGYVNTNYMPEGLNGPARHPGDIESGMNSPSDHPGNIESGMNSPSDHPGNNVPKRTPQSNHPGGSASGAASGVTKTGVSLGAKIAIGVVSALVVVALGVGTVKLLKPKNSAKEVTTEAATQVADNTTTSAATSEAATSETATTEAAPVDDTAERYAAYYDVVKEYMQNYPVSMEDSKVSGFEYAELVDFENSDSKQLVVAYGESEVSTTTGEYTIKIYNYIDGKAVEVATFENDELCYVEGKDGISLWTTNGYIWENSGFTCEKTEYTYDGEKFVSQHKYNIEEVVGFPENSGSMGVISSTASIDGVDSSFDDVKEKLLEIDKTSERYVFNAKLANYDLSFEGVTRALMVKHKTIDELAETVSDEEFCNSADDVRLEDVSDGNEYKYVFTENKYNEKYMLNFRKADIDNSSASYQVSEDKKIITGCDIATVGWGQLGYGDFCWAYVNDVLVVIGGSVNPGNMESDHFWLDENDFITQNVPSQCDENKVTKEEFDANVQALLDR